MKPYYYNGKLIGYTEKAETKGCFWVYPAHDKENESFWVGINAAKRQLRDIYLQNKDSFNYQTRQQVITEAVRFCLKHLGLDAFKKLYPNISISLCLQPNN